MKRSEHKNTRRAERRVAKASAGRRPISAYAEWKDDIFEGQHPREITEETADVRNEKRMLKKKRDDLLTGRLPGLDEMYPTSKWWQLQPYDRYEVNDQGEQIRVRVPVHQEEEFWMERAKRENEEATRANRFEKRLRDVLVKVSEALTAIQDSRNRLGTYDELSDDDEHDYKQATVAAHQAYLHALKHYQSPIPKPGLVVVKFWRHLIDQVGRTLEWIEEKPESTPERREKLEALTKIHDILCGIESHIAMQKKKSSPVKGQLHVSDEDSSESDLPSRVITFTPRQLSSVRGDESDSDQSYVVLFTPRESPQRGEQ